MSVAAILMLLFKADYRRKAAEIRHNAATAAAMLAAIASPLEGIEGGDLRLRASDNDTTPLLITRE